MNLHVYREDNDSVIAESKEEAREIWLEFMLDYLDQEDIDDIGSGEIFHLLADDYKISIFTGIDNDTGEPCNLVTKTAKEWIDQKGKGILCVEAY